MIQQLSNLSSIRLRLPPITEFTGNVVVKSLCFLLAFSRRYPTVSITLVCRVSSMWKP